MLCKTRGIVLGQIPFKESSLIIKIYTEEFGTRGFIQSAAKKQMKKSKTAYFLPLSLLDLVIYHKENRDLDTISEVKFLKPFSSIPFETSRSSIAIFLSEFLNQVLRHEHSDPSKFSFLYQRILDLDNPQFSYLDFPVHFLFDLTGILGFRPSLMVDIQDELELTKDYQGVQTHIKSMVEKQERPEFKSGKDRMKALEILLRFYSNHVENFREIKSLPILHEVLA